MTQQFLMTFIAVFTTSLALDCASADVLTIPQTSFRRCTQASEPGACYELADLYGHTSKPGDLALSRQYARYGCKLELKKACSDKDVESRSGAYLKSKKDWDAARQKALIEMPSVKTKAEVACESGSANDCGAAAVHYLYLAPTLNPEKGKAMYTEGCRLGDQKSCKSLELLNKGVVHVHDVEM